MNEDTKKNEEPKLTNVCNTCWYLCDANWNRVRAMISNDDNKNLSHGPCNTCAPELRKQLALYRSVEHKREITLTKSLHNQIQMNAWKRPHVAATI
jgi:hypothetical protein